MRWLLSTLVILLLVLQYRLWFAEGSLAEQHRLEQRVQEQAATNRALRERNAVLEREVLALQSGNESVEQRAREQLGLIREGEVFYQFADANDPRASSGPGKPGTPAAPDTATDSSGAVAATAEAARDE